MKIKQMLAQKKELEEQKLGRMTRSEVIEFDGGFIPKGQGTKLCSSLGMSSDEEIQKDKQNVTAKISANASDSQPITAQRPSTVLSLADGETTHTSGNTEKPQEKRSPRKKLVRPSEYKNKLDAILQRDVNAFVERERAKLAKGKQNETK